MKLYGKYLFDNERNQWKLFDLDTHVIIMLKRLFPKISQASRPPFYFNDTLEIARDLTWFMDRYPLEASEDDSNKLKIKNLMFIKRNENFEKILSFDYEPKNSIELKNGKSLRIYQQQPVELILKNKFLLLGDDLGLGKTVTGIGLIVQSKKFPAIVVVPTHLAYHWFEKIKEFTWLEPHIITQTKPYNYPKTADVLIFKYSCLAGWIDHFNLMKYSTLIFDEIHYLRREDSARYKASEELASHAEYKLGLSATPIFNYGDEIFNIVNVLKPEILGNKYQFLREWGTNGKQIKDPKSLGSYLRDNYIFLRRTTEDVGRELPPINKIVQNVDFDAHMVKESENLMKELAMRVVNGPPIQQGMAAMQLDVLVRKLTGISKAKAVAEYVKILIDNGRPVLLTGWHRDVYEIWEKSFEGYDPVFYTGEESAKQKDESFKKIKSGKTKLMIISLRSGEGLDGLQYKCKDIVFGELDWSPAVHEQLIGRINRDGQTDIVTAHFLVSDSGSDPLMIELLGLKTSQSREIVDPDKEIQENYSDNSKMKKLAEQILKNKIN